MFLIYSPLIHDTECYIISVSITNQYSLVILKYILTVYIPIKSREIKYFYMHNSRKNKVLLQRRKTSRSLRSIFILVPSKEQCLKRLNCALKNNEKESLPIVDKKLCI